MKGCWSVLILFKEAPGSISELLFFCPGYLDQARLVLFHDRYLHARKITVNNNKLKILVLYWGVELKLNENIAVFWEDTTGWGAILRPRNTVHILTINRALGQYIMDLTALLNFSLPLCQNFHTDEYWTRLGLDFHFHASDFITIWCCSSRMKGHGFAWYFLFGSFYSVIKEESRQHILIAFWCPA